jgi:prepilin-type N-terminal cleavage/methylation domain-containing protein
MPKLTQHGFTIIELMIATTVFSLVLLLCSTGLIQIGRTYTKGMTSAKTQSTARAVMDEISRAIQFSGGSIATTPASRVDGVPYVFCIDDKRFSVVADRELKDNLAATSEVRDVLVSDSFPGCSASIPPLALADVNFNVSTVTGAKELLAPNMRIAKLQVNDKGGNLYEIVLRIVYGDDDVLDAAHDNCQNVKAGSQFCAVSELTTVVQKRL